VTAAGIILLVVAMALFIAEGHLNSHGVLGLGGVVALILSGLLLFDTGDEDEISAPVVIVTGLVLGAFFAFVVDRAVRARREPVHTGHEELVGQSAEVRTPLAPEGQVWLQGALWRARVADGSGPIGTGDRVRVDSVDGLTLLVRPETRSEIEGGTH
jgi:membrane-bound serine protease (ClpP class)